LFPHYPWLIKNSRRAFPADAVLKAERPNFPGRSTYTLLRKGGFTAEMEFEIAEILLLRTRH
jgi:hypothetical protein